MVPKPATYARRWSGDSNPDPGPNIPAIIGPIFAVVFIIMLISCCFASQRQRKRVEEVKRSAPASFPMRPYVPFQSVQRPGAQGLSAAEEGRAPVPSVRRRETDGLLNPPPAYEAVESARVEGALYTEQLSANATRPLPPRPGSSHSNHRDSRRISSW
ncbi:hypothetical protein EJ04DRAFT_230986 [Polyplosphaeria fusca]|uniref:Uncharacterized protein n=1 Tax=Polyplosphaeria fusca TaxID=682080 RepID=A0A9P4V1L2_9PLEO|nr:hypothetical protein EJ04DRAFT_230986 [Polyplosphaeria fusca]